MDTPREKSQKIERGAVAGSGALAGDVVGAVKVAKGRGTVARRQDHDRAGAEDVAEERGRGKTHGNQR